MKKAICGVYIIKNTVNEKVYIGSSIDCQKRFTQHKFDFIHNRHNERFQNFVNKYGIDTLVFEIVEVVEDADKLLEREQYWIDFYKSYKSNKGFNICKIAGNSLGAKMPKSQREARQKYMNGNKYRIGKKWTEEEKREIGLRTKQMWGNNPNKKKLMAQKISTLKKGKPIWSGKKHPMLGKISTRRKWIAVYLNNELIDECFGTKEVCVKYSLDRAAVTRVCNGILKTTRGYVLRYIDKK